MGAALFSFISSFLPAGSFSVYSFLKGTGTYASKIVPLLLAIFGIVLVGYGAFCITKAIMGRAGSTGPHWLRSILALIFGGTMIAGGWKFYKNVAQGGKQTVTSLGNGGSANDIVGFVHNAVMSGAIDVTHVVNQLVSVDLLGSIGHLFGL